MTTYYWASISEDDSDIGYVRDKIHTAKSIDTAIKNGYKYMKTEFADYIIISRTNDRSKMLLKSNTVGYIADFGRGPIYESMGTGKQYRISKDGTRK